MPRPPEGSRRAEQKSSEPRLSRVEQMKRRGVTPELPPNPLPHLVGQLIEIGLTQAAGMGAGPISWAEIDAWCNRTRVDLAPWESRLLRRLSIDYVAEGRRAEDETYPPPWRTPVTVAEINSEADALRALLSR